jgi:hypothetical protein
MVRRKLDRKSFGDHMNRKKVSESTWTEEEVIFFSFSFSVTTVSGEDVTKKNFQGQVVSKEVSKEVLGIMCSGKE